jgi:predicted RNase H-like HicB family nuclease
MPTRNYTFPIIIEKEPEDPGYFAHSPLLPGCYTDGLTIEETRQNMKEAIQLYVDALIERGMPVPTMNRNDLIVVEDLVVPIPA